MSKNPSSSTSDSVSSTSTIQCFFDASTCKRQRFSIPEKIVYYIAKNVTNVKTYQKLVQTCKYFFVINPVIIVPKIECYRHEWYACYGVEWEYRVGFKCGQPINFKIWVTECFACTSGNATQMIPLIYKNDATFVRLRSGPSKLKELLFLTGNAKHLSLSNQLVKYEDGKTVQLEDIVKDLPKLESLYFDSCSDGSDVNCNTVRNLKQIKHFKSICQIILSNVSEALDVKQMFDLILDNRRMFIDIYYRQEISDACKELIRKYSNRLKQKGGYEADIKYFETNDDEFTTSSSEDDSSDTSFDSFEDDGVSSSDDDDDNLMFPWKNEDDEEWELPWDIWRMNE